MTATRDLDAWALEVTDPEPDRDLGELAEWAADIVVDHDPAAE
jgi:hypothetical protein